MCVQSGEFGILVKFLRYRRSKPDRVPIIERALREARLDRAPGCQNHEENYPVSSKACKASSRLVRQPVNTIATRSWAEFWISQHQSAHV